MKLDRLIAILSVLLNQEQATAPELAKRFEVSRRTINRDIEALNQAGIPIVTQQGAGGGIRIVDGFRMDRTALTSREMQAILSGLRGLDSVSGTSQYKQLMEKISPGAADVLPGDQHILIDLASWHKASLSGKIELLHGAIAQHRLVSFHYLSPGGESDRIVEPALLIFQVLRGSLRRLIVSLGRTLDLPELAGTIPYELLCGVSLRVPRIYM